MPTQIPQYGATTDPVQIEANKANLEKNKAAINAGATEFDSSGNWITPKVSSIVGSNDPLITKRVEEGKNNAGNSITGPKTSPDALVPGSYVDSDGRLIKPGDSGYKAPSTGGTSDIVARVTAANSEALDISRKAAERALSANQLQYSADLASSNAKYDSLFKDLKAKFITSLEAADQNAVTLNPYSLSRGATTAENFKGKITENFNNAAAQLQTQADLAKQELAAGNYKNYVDIQNNLDKIVMNTIQENNKLMLDFTKQAEQVRQFEVGQKNVWADNFRQQISTIALDPKMVDEMVANGSIFKDPTYQSGINAGYSPEGVIDSMKSGSLALKKQQDLETYRTNQLIRSQEKLTQAQMANLAATKVSNAILELNSRGIKYGTPEYATAVASASQGGTRPSQADRDRYAVLDSLSSSLPRLKNDIEKLGDNTQLWNIVNKATKNPFSSDVTKFTGGMESIAMQIGTAVFGTGKQLSDKDLALILSSVGNSYQPKNVREGLFNELLKKVVDAGTAKLISDANAGVDVSNYVYTIKNIQDNISASKIDTGAKTYQGFKLPY